MIILYFFVVVLYYILNNKYTRTTIKKTQIKFRKTPLDGVERFGGVHVPNDFP